MSREYVHVWFDKNDNLLGIDGLRDQEATAGVYINDAVITAELFDGTTGVALAGTVIAMTYKAATNGSYRARYPASIPLTLGKLYIARLSIVGGGLTGSHDVEFRPTVRH